MDNSCLRIKEGQVFCLLDGNQAVPFCTGRSASDTATSLKVERHFSDLKYEVRVDAATQLILKFCIDICILLDSVVVIVAIFHFTIPGMSCPDHLPEMSAFIIVVPTPNRYIPDIGMVVSGGEDGAVEIVIKPSPSNLLRKIGNFTPPSLPPVSLQAL